MWTFLSQFRLTIHHIQRIKKEVVEYISSNNFDALLGESSRSLGNEPFQGIDIQLDLTMHTAGVLEGWSLGEYKEDYQCVFYTLSDGLEARLIDRYL